MHFVSWTASLASASATRPKMYTTICWLTEDCIPRPNTTYPATNPARKVSYEASLPVGDPGPSRGK